MIAPRKSFRRSSITTSRCARVLAVVGIITSVFLHMLCMDMTVELVDATVCFTARLTYESFGMGLLHVDLVLLPLKEGFGALFAGEKTTCPMISDSFLGGSAGRTYSIGNICVAV